MCPLSMWMWLLWSLGVGTRVRYLNDIPSGGAGGVVEDLPGSRSGRVTWNLTRRAWRDTCHAVIGRESSLHPCSAVACLSIRNLNLPVLPSCLRRIWRVLRSHETRVNVTIPVTHVMTSVTCRDTASIQSRVSPEQTWADQHQPRYQGHQISFH